MERIMLEERADWIADAQACGFTFHHMSGERYWDERKAYAFSLAEIEDRIEDPTAKLVKMCNALVDRVTGDSGLMTRLAIPESVHAGVRRSWERRDKDLYGRFDLCYGGKGPAKLLEFNADTPTSLFESAVFQWRWLEALKARGQLPAAADQFNSLHERLVAAFGRLIPAGGILHLACMTESEEDLGTVKYLQDCAVQAGLMAEIIDMSSIAVDADGWFLDADDYRIEHMFKLYPLEFMVREPFGDYLSDTPTQIIEPLWKMILSNKGILPLLWEMYPGHENLLPAYFSDDLRVQDLPQQVRKPLLSREGANITIEAGAHVETVDGPYGAEGYVVQAFHPLPRFGDDWAVIGSWVVEGQPAGIGIREDNSAITGDSSRFVPHFIRP